MAGWHAGCILATMSIAGLVPGASAQDQGPGGIAFDGVARTGTDTRPVQFRFFCSSNDGPNVTGALVVELEIPQYEQLRAVFDFDPFEGPDAHAGPLTQLRAEGARTRSGDRFTASGSISASGSPGTFVLEVAASRREAGPLRRLASVLRPLTGGPAQLEWRQGNAKPGGTPMIASLDLSQVQSNQLKGGLGPCLGARQVGIKAKEGTHA
jgi:hypothetical protein